MRRIKFEILILTIICLHTNMYADIAPFSIEAKTISSKFQTSIRMESEKVIIDLYNDSSVVKCFFYMKNIGEQEKLQIGYPDMSFYHFTSKSNEGVINKFIVKENSKIIKVNIPDYLKYDKKDPDKIPNLLRYKPEWFLWESEFQKGESKTIEVQYSLSYGAFYKSNKRFFTYLLSTGANWKGTIGKAEIIVNIKDIEMDSIITQQPDNSEILNKQLSWTFTDFEPTTHHDIKVYYNSNRLNKVAGPDPLCIINGKIEEDFDIDLVSPTDIVSFEKINTSEEYRNYSKANNGIVKIYTKDFVLSKLEELIEIKLKRKIIFQGYHQLKENYCLFINEIDVDFSEVTDIDKTSIANMEIEDSKDHKSKIMIELK